MTKEQIFGAVVGASNLGLNMDNATSRVLQRAVIVGLITFAGELIVGYSDVVNPIYLPILVALGASIDKALREYLDSLKAKSARK